MTPQDISKIMEGIATKVRGKLNIPMGTKPTELYKLQNITKLTVYSKDGNLVFITTLPLVKDTELIMYNVIPIPFNKNQSSNYVLIKVDSPFTAITKDRKQYTTFTERQKLACKEATIYRVCGTYQPIQENSGSPPCEIGLFNKPDKLSETCQPQTTTLNRNIYHKLKYQNIWIYAIENYVLTISCKNLQETIVEQINGTETIQIIDTTCQINKKTRRNKSD